MKHNHIIYVTMKSLGTTVSMVKWTHILLLLNSIGFMTCLLALLNQADCDINNMQLKETASFAPPEITITVDNHANTRDNNDPLREKDNDIPARLARYMSRYHYAPPNRIRTQSERDALCGSPPHYRTYFNQGTGGNKPGQVHKRRSANQEDRTIYEMFFKHNNPQIDKKGGVVELGAYDGIEESNSRFFEECLGWNAVLIEGMPESFEKLMTNRPSAHRFNFAPTCSQQEDENNKTVRFDNYPFPNAGLGDVRTNYSSRNRTVDVACGSLTPILMDLFPDNGHVTFFSLDVEGAEGLVVKNIDFSRVYIEVMMIEHTNSFCDVEYCESRNEFRKIMDDNGYIRFTRAVRKSDLYIHRDSKEHLAAVLKSSKDLEEEYKLFMKNKSGGDNEIPKGACFGVQPNSRGDQDGCIRDLCFCLKKRSI